VTLSVAYCRGEDAASVRFTEMSLLNGFGLKYLHAFFNVPFLALQVSSRSSYLISSLLGSSLLVWMRELIVLMNMLISKQKCSKSFQ